MRAQYLLIRLACFVVLAAALNLQAGTSTTGSISGTVYDSTGAVLRGVHLTIEGPHLPGTRSTTTTREGLYKFALLPAGNGYLVRANLDGFQEVVSTEISVRLGSNARLPIVMTPATAREEITVRATPSLVDLRDTSSSTNITEELFEALPTTRDYQYLTTLAPGVLFEIFETPRTPTGAPNDHPSPTVGGATHLENDYVIEGLSTRDPMTGGSATKITMDFVKEVQVMTGEYSAEYGRALGGVINVVTKSGSNQLQGSLFTYQQDSDWTSDTVRSSRFGNDEFDLGHDKNDWGGSLGGPILRDRAWFFLSYDLRDDVAPLNIVNEAYGLDRDEEIKKKENVYAAKVNLAATPAHLLTLSGFGNPSTTSGWLYGGSISAPEVSLITQDSGATNLSLRYEATLAPSWFVEATIGRHRQDLDTTPNTQQGRVAPMQGDFSVNPVFYRGGHPYAGIEEAARDYFSIRSSHLWGSHEIRYGGDLEKNQYDQDTTFAGYWFYGQREINEELGVQDYMMEFLADFSGWGTNDGTAVFLEDRWQVTSDLFVSLGLRWERQELSSSKGVNIAEGRAADGTIIRRAADSFVLDDNWAPRLGISWDPSGNGRARVYATAGRFFESIPVYLNVWSLSGQRGEINFYYSPIQHTSENWWNPNGSPVDSDWILLDSDEFEATNGFVPGPTPLDPDMKLQNQIEYSVGGELAIGSAWTVGARLIRREMKDVIEDHRVFDENGQWVDYAISNIGPGPYADEFREPERIYEAVELMLQRRLTDRWQVYTSFVSSRARGDIDGLFRYASPNFAAPNVTFDVEEPRFQRFSYGKLRSDRPYQFKIHSSYRFPFGLTLSEGLIYSAGFPYSAFAGRLDLTGFRIVYLTPRGSAGRTPDYYSLDLHADWEIPFTFGRGMSATLIADIFNVTDEHEALAVDEEYFYRGMPGWQEWLKPSNLDENGLPKFNPDLPKSPYFGTPTLYQPPRSFQVGVKLLF